MNDNFVKMFKANELGRPLTEEEVAELKQPRKRFRRSPIETTTGMIRVKVYVQQDKEDRWIAKVHGSSPISYAGQTRKEAIQLALKGASITPH